MLLHMRPRIGRHCPKLSNDVQNLSTARTNLHITNLLTHTLYTLPSKNPSLPPDLHQTIDLLVALLTAQIPPSFRDILNPSLSTALSQIPTLAPYLSSHLATLAHLLSTIASPFSPPTLSTLATQATHLRETTTTTLPRALAAATTHLATTAHATLTTHRHLLTTSIVILEQAQHGSLARDTKARADALAARAALLGLQARLHSLAHPPPAQFVAALKEFRRLQGLGERGLRDRESLARRELQLYGKAGEKGMRDLARRKDGLLREMERVRKEVEGLESERGT